MRKLIVSIGVAASLSGIMADCVAGQTRSVDDGLAGQVTIAGDGALHGTGVSAEALTPDRHRNMPRVAAGGHEVPLRHALEEIVPPDYSINLPNAGAWADVPVSWRAHQPFAAALREALAAAPDLSAQVDANLRLVTVRMRAQSFGDDGAFAMKHVAHAPSSLAASTSPYSQPGASAPAPAPSMQPARYAAAAVPTAAPAAAVPTSFQPSAKAAAPAPIATPAMLAPTVVPSIPAPALVPKAAAASSASAAASASASAAASASASADADAPSAPTPAPAEPVKTWRLELSDHTVKTALTRWAKESGWQIVWDVPIDFGIDADATITATFEDALQSVVQALQKTETPIQAVLYKGNRVLRIVPKGAA